MRFEFHIALIVSLLGLTACSEPPPPRSVTEFLENSILLEAALVRCTQNRAESRYDAECMNAREAVRISVAETRKERRSALEAESKRKRDALRRRQWAVAEARRRAAEAAQRREEAEYLAQFGELPVAETAAEDVMNSNIPMAVVPETEVSEPISTNTTLLPTSGSNAPVVEIEVVPETEVGSDLADIREELRRRNDDGTEQ